MGTKRVHMTFPENLVQEPVLYNMAKNFEVVTNIRRANVEDNFGWVILELVGDEGSIAKALEYCEGLGVQVSTIDGDVVEG